MVHEAHNLSSVRLAEVVQQLQAWLDAHPDWEDACVRENSSGQVYVVRYRPETDDEIACRRKYLEQSLHKCCNPGSYNYFFTELNDTQQRYVVRSLKDEDGMRAMGYLK